MAIPLISFGESNLVLVLLSAILAEMRVSKTATKATLKAPKMTAATEMYFIFLFTFG